MEKARKIDKHKPQIENDSCPICDNKQLLKYITINKKSCTDCGIDIDYFKVLDMNFAANTKNEI